MFPAGHGRIQSGPQLVVQELPLLPDMLGQVFLGGIGMARMRRHWNPNPFRNVRIWVGSRRRPVNCSIRSHASAAVRTGAAVSKAPNGVREGRQVADGAGHVPLTESVQAAVPIGGDIALHGGSPEAGDGRRLRPGESTMEQPQDQHLAADMGLRVRLPLSLHHFLFRSRQLHAMPSHSGTPPKTSRIITTIRML